MRKAFFLSLLLLLAAPAEGSQRIIGGSDTTVASWPGIVSLQDRGALSAYWGHFCGGSLVRPRWVLTAEHCTKDASPDNLDVVLGRSNLRQRGGERIAVVRILAHPQHDIALLYLARASEARTFPISRTRPPDGSLGTTAGWGATRTSMPAGLQRVDVLAISDAECQKSYPWDFRAASEICAGWMEGGRDACQGDSGGPLLFEGQLVGVTSYGSGCGERGYPGVYAKVPVSWVEGRFQNPPTNFRPQTPGRETWIDPRPYVALTGTFSYPSGDRPYYEHETSVTSNYHIRELRMRIERGSSPYCIQTGACYKPGQWFLPPTANGGKSSVIYYKTTTTCPLVSFWARLENGTTRSGQTRMCLQSPASKAPGRAINNLILEKQEALFAKSL